MSKRIKIDRLASEVSSCLKEYGETTSEGVKRAVRETGNVVRDEIKSGAPKRHGDYQKSWSTKKLKENSNTLVLTVHSRNRYQLAHLLEHGHAKRGGGRTRAFPHIAPAEADGIKLLEEKIKRSIRNG